MTQEIHFNTGRMYTAQGQEIKAKLLDNNVYFYDQSRMIGGKFELSEYSNFSEKSVMRRYDNNNYEMWIPPRNFFSTDYQFDK